MTPRAIRPATRPSAIGRLAAIASLGACAALAACGGAPSMAECTLDASCAGGFTISKDALAFATKLHRPPPAPQVIRVHLRDAVAIDLVASVSTSGAPATAGAAGAAEWLVAVSGAAPDLAITIGLAAAPGDAGHRNAVLTLTSMDAHGPLQSRSVPITLDVARSLSATIGDAAPSFTLGSPDTSAVIALDIDADPATEWRITGSDPWIVAPDSPGRGTARASVIIDAAGLELGQYAGTLTAASTSDATDLAVLPIALAVAPPRLAAAPADLAFGGADGLDATTAHTVALSLATGANRYPWTAAITTDDGSPWLALDQRSGMVGGAPLAVEVAIDRSAMSPGRHSGAVRFEATIAGTRVARSLAVTVNREGHWLVASALGVALSSFPGRRTLTRTLIIRSSQHRSDAPWTASADQPWLAITPSGLTGGELAIVADPTGLAPGQYFATVTVRSPDRAIANQERIRVGLRIGASDPGPVDIARTFERALPNPVEPYVYAAVDRRDIAVYDVYTGALVRTFAGAVGRTGELAISADGATLFVDDTANLRVAALDATTGAELARYPWGTSLGGGITYARPSAHPILVLGRDRSYDLTTGEPDPAWGAIQVVDPFSDRGFAASPLGFSPGRVGQYTLAYSALRGLAIERGPENGFSVDGGPLCVSGDGAWVYTNNLGSGFAALDAGDLHPIQTFAGSQFSNNVACGWNGLLFGGAGPAIDLVNLWVYRRDGTLVASSVMNPGTIRSMVTGTLMLAGDNTRVMASFQTSSSDTSSFHIRTSPVP